MIPTSQVAAIALGFIKKTFTFHNGALIVPAVTVSPVFPELIDKIMANTTHKDLAIPVLSAGVGLLCYLVIFGTDFITGLRASKFEAKGAPGYIKSDKLWSSFWKLFGVLLVLMFLIMFCLLFAFIDNDFFYSAFLYGIVGLMIMVCLFDLHSIGENHKRRYGTKPPHYEFLDRVIKKIDEKIMQKITSL
ncbi:Bacteriophage holin family protein [Salinimicrobium sediminis]|uniref:Bacteriophage holin family protein n=1 Tax=Salinimicrobium sediminis TaxID=1343891 RepID=A0A285X399_9FLAO|nr:phage holin family protein [Salinimicrobium sediminis]SOC79813.1 Bacteriophage holin family protein [Salinimicrobium sediminis]